ncbi:exonuclease SbcCD subunit D [Thalassiella azotivora]
MRILHTSDWHLGRSFHRVGLLDEQARFLDHLADVVRREAVDVVVVAGDVYDRALPSVDAVQVLDDGLDALLDTGARVLVTSGNHDSATRLGFGANRSARAGLHLRTALAQADRPLVLEDGHGPVALYGLPYLEPSLVADELGCARSHPAVLGAALDRVRADLAGRPGARAVVAAHAFVVGGQGSDSERDISVGGVSSVPSEVFDGVDYVALGHLHGPQRLAEHVRYSGSPLAYSFSERDHRKGSWLVELEAGGVTRVDHVPAPVPRPLAALRGTLEEVLGDPALAVHEGSWCQVTLTDARRPAEPMERLRARFPHVLSLVLEPQGGADAAGGYAERVRGLDDVGLCCSFLEHVRGEGPDEREAALLRQGLEAVRVAADAESPTAGPEVAAGRRAGGRAGASGRGDAADRAVGAA